MAQIVPKSKAPGVDFCGSNGTHYIVRSDLGFYLRATNFHEPGDLEVFCLSNLCRGGHHYLAHEDGFFYVIKGNAYCRVSDMSKDTNDVIYNLHPNCQGGDHYLSTSGYFYIIFQSKGFYRKVKNISTNEGSQQYSLHPSCKNGLYYWGENNYFYFVKPQNDTSVQYYRCNDLNDKPNIDTYTFRDDVVNFLPGGPAVTQGSASGKWECLKDVPNKESFPTVWNNDISRKVGCNEQARSLLEHNWKMNTSASDQAAVLGEAIVKYQLSLPKEYGGMGVNTDQEEWSEAMEVGQSINMNLQPRETIKIWMYNLYLGNIIVLFSTYIDFTNNSTAPNYCPLPPFNK